MRQKKKKVTRPPTVTNDDQATSSMPGGGGSDPLNESQYSYYTVDTNAGDMSMMASNMGAAEATM